MGQQLNNLKEKIIFLFGCKTGVLDSEMTANASQKKTASFKGIEILFFEVSDNFLYDCINKKIFNR
jgi:hypothetical protein